MLLVQAKPNLTATIVETPLEKAFEKSSAVWKAIALWVCLAAALAATELKMACFGS